jgi:O-antigen biosynthesis protein
MNHPVSEPTGERFIPEVWGSEVLGAEHVARYKLASQLAQGRTVLDAGCGVGWGTALLVEAGAQSATGVDISPIAIEDSRNREPRGRFVVGDLRSLPFSDKQFDLITCFEAIEHVEEPSRALDELARLLAPGGILLVSSPNPRVYPQGNPYHVHEFTPEELSQEVAARFSSVSLWRQFGLVASALVEGQPWAAGDAIPMIGGSVVNEVADHDPYNLVVATNDEQPALTGVVMFAPSPQLPYLYDSRELLEQERQNVAALLVEAEQRITTAVDQLEGEIAAMRASASWRSTAWLRSLSGAVRRR